MNGRTGPLVEAPVVAPPRPRAGETDSPKPRMVVRKGRLRDVGGLVRFYLGLSEEARYRFHPFPFSRAALYPAYATILAAQAALHPLMRRFPRLVVGLVVAEPEGGGRIVGYGTMRGVRWKGEAPRVRFGFVVGDGYRGYGIGPRLLRGMAKVAVSYGYRWEIGAVFASDQVAIRALQKFGVKFYESNWVDRRAPQEKNLWTEGDLHEILRLTAFVEPGLASPNIDST